MDKKQNISSFTQQRTGTDPFKKEEVYRREIHRLLDMRPEMADFQKEIERRLNCAGTFQNRMAVLGIMMEVKLNELQQNLVALADKVCDWDALTQGR